METMTYERNTEYQTLRALMRRSTGDGTNRLLAAALAEELTERQAQMVQLYYIEQHSIRDIAAMLGVNPSTVSRSLKSARTRLRRALRYTSRAFLHEEDED